MKYLSPALSALALVVSLGSVAVAVGPTNVDGPLNVHEAGQVSLCLDTADPIYGDDCWMSSSGGGFYLAAESGGFVMALDGTGIVFSLPGTTPLLRALLVESGNDSTTAGPPLLYHTASWSGNVCIWAGAASNGGLVVYLERAFPPGWKNYSLTDSLVAKPGTLDPAFITWTGLYNGWAEGIVTDPQGVKAYDRCYRVTIQVIADPPS